MREHDDAVTLHVPGSPSAPASARFRPRSARERALRALGAVALFWIPIPVVFLVPPHLPWALLAFGLGLFFGLRQWRGTHVVEHFGGRCPHCGEALELEEGSKVRMPLRLTCYGCHREAVLRMGPERGP